MSGCPYVAGPACRDCSGSCWEPSPPREPEPILCEWCSKWNDTMQEHDGTCDNISEDQWIAKLEA